MRFRIARIAIGVVAFVLWVATADSTWGHLDGGRGLTIEGCGALFLSLLDWDLWRERRAEKTVRDRVVRRLADALVDSASRRAAVSRTLPLRAVR